jgi:hypothetical protein
MKSLGFLAAFFILLNSVAAQPNKLPPIEESPSGGNISAQAETPAPLLQMKSVHPHIQNVNQVNPRGYFFKHKSKGVNDFDAQATHFEMRIYYPVPRTWSDATHAQFLKDIKNDTISNIVFKFGADSQAKHMAALQNAYKNVELGFIECDSLWGRPALSYTVKCEIYNNDMLKLVKKTVITGRRYIVFYQGHMIDLWWHATPDEHRWNDIAREQLKLMSVLGT